MTGDRSLRDYDFDNGDEDVIDDPLVFLAQPDSLILTREFADRNDIQSGSEDHLRHHAKGRSSSPSAASSRPAAWRRPSAATSAIMDIYAAQHVFGRGRRFDRIDIGAPRGRHARAGRGRHPQAHRPRLHASSRPRAAARQFESLLGVYTLAMNVSSLFALFIGMFIIYNSFSIAVTQRRGEIGILRALGATRGQIRTLFLGESARRRR